MTADLASKDYLTLLNEDIPNGREDLIITSKSLDNVAQHCLDNYDENSLEQTVNYTAQALGSVAYKINLLATNFLSVLDQQHSKLNGLQTKVNHLSMQVKIHHEKSSRLSIGKFTLPREIKPRELPKNIEPIFEINDNYQRSAIDYSIFDNIGHGIKGSQIGGSNAGFCSIGKQSSVTGSESQQYGFGPTSPKTDSEVSLKYGKFQTIGPAAASNYRSPGSTTSKSQFAMVSPNVVGTPCPISPPPVSNYGTGLNYPTTLQGTRRSSSSTVSGGQPRQYSTPVITSSPRPPNSPYMCPGPASMLPPPPPPPSINETSTTMVHEIRYEDLPRPPSIAYETNLAALPPPPSNFNQYDINSSNDIRADTVRISNRMSTESTLIDNLLPSLHDTVQYKQPDEPAWAPNEYICKVESIYMYQQNKPDELSFQPQELIYVVKKNTDGWWYGTKINGSGLFPGNYVQLLE